MSPWPLQVASTRDGAFLSPAEAGQRLRAARARVNRAKRARREKGAGWGMVGTSGGVCGKARVGGDVSRRGESGRRAPIVVRAAGDGRSSEGVQEARIPG